MGAVQPRSVGIYIRESRENLFNILVLNIRIILYRAKTECMPKAVENPASEPVGT